MTTTALRNVSPIFGAIIERVRRDTCETYLQQLIDEPELITPELDMRWMLALSDDGVTWGRYDTPSGRWYFGSEVAPSIAPRIRRERLQEIRIYGAQAELLMWRTGHNFCGRLLLDPVSPTLQGREVQPLATDAHPLRPSAFEYRILRGDTLHKQSIDTDGFSTCGRGFSHVLDQAGAQQVIPLRVSVDQLKKRQVCLQVQHYYQSIVDSGAVRVAATRWVNILIRGEQ